MTRRTAQEGNPMDCERCGWNGVTEMYYPYKYCVRWRCAKCHRRIA